MDDKNSPEWAPLGSEYGYRYVGNSDSAYRRYGEESQRIMFWCGYALFLIWSTLLIWMVVQ